MRRSTKRMAGEAGCLTDAVGRPLPDDMKVVDCSGCRSVLSVNRFTNFFVPWVGGRIKGLPYCERCLSRIRLVLNLTAPDPDPTEGSLWDLWSGLRDESSEVEP